MTHKEWCQMERCVNCMIDVGEPCQCSCTCERREGERRKVLWPNGPITDVDQRRGPDRRKRDD